MRIVPEIVPWFSLWYDIPDSVYSRVKVVTAAFYNDMGDREIKGVGKNTTIEFEVSEEMLSIARERFQYFPQIKIYKGDMRSLDFLPDNVADFTLCSWVIQHLIDPSDFIKGLKELSRITKSIGIILIADDSPPTSLPFINYLIKRDNFGGWWNISI